ncbi:MAG: hypothetical protein ACE5G8_11505 [Anaerolineae bacterium]
MMKRYVSIFTVCLLALLLTGVPASAEQGVGSNPYVAHLLSSGLNVGSLAPSQAFWYSFTRQDLGNLSIRSAILNLVFKPGDSRTARQVTFDVYTFEQVKTFLEAGQTANNGQGGGQLATSDYDLNTGNRLWAGTVEADEIYYVQIQNKSDLTVDYRLTVVPQQATLPAALPAGIAAAATSAVAVPPASPPPVPAAPSETTSPAPASEWLLVAQAMQGMPAEQAAVWLQNAVELGWLPNPAGSKTPAAASTPVQPAAGTSKPPQAVPAPPAADNSVYPNQPLELLDNNVSRLAPHAEHWYTFLSDDLDENRFEEMSLTMFQTPGDGNIANLVNFQLFTGDQYPIWARGTPDQMVNFGAGQIVSRDNDPNTGERLWRGTIVDGDRYYLKIKNDSEVWVDYYLLTGDVPNTELGAMAKTRPVSRSVLPAQRIADIQVPPQEPPGSSIASALTAAPGHSGRWLEPGEDIWFAFRFQNFEQPEPEFRHYTMYLRHTPGLGYIANHVNLELYTYPALNLWLRGDGALMTPMGVGSRDAYQARTNTQLFVWDGQLVSDTTYFLRIRNDSEVGIYYDLDIQRR